MFCQVNYAKNHALTKEIQDLCFPGLTYDNDSLLIPNNFNCSISTKFEELNASTFVKHCLRQPISTKIGLPKKCNSFVS